MLESPSGYHGDRALQGGDSKLAGQQRVIRLASNESPLGPSPQADRAPIAIWRTRLHRYPDGGQDALRAAIGRPSPAAEPTQVVCGAGSDELIGLLVRAYAGPGDEVLYSEYGFLMYADRGQGGRRDAGRGARRRDCTADVDALLARVTPRTRVVLLANPNNPTGSLLPARERCARLHAGLPKRRAAGDRCRLCRICRQRRLRGRRSRWSPRTTTS